MRHMWNGSIGFALVNIPVKMYVATEESRLPFVSLDKNNHAQIRYKKVNEITGKEVAFQDIVKAYKFGNEMIIVEEEDFKRAAPEKKDHLEIVQFVQEKDIDAVYFEKPYYLAPDKGGAKPYSLLRDALKKHDMAALGPMVYHGREWICLIKPSEEVLVLHRLRFPEEIRPVSELNIPRQTTDQRK
jgi:DNA end-binding protein Ku